MVISSKFPEFPRESLWINCILHNLIEYYETQLLAHKR